jgi:DNA polymerase-1
MTVISMPDFDEAMGFEIFTDEVQDSYDICFLVPGLYKPDMERFYVDPLLVGQDEIAFAFSLLKSPKRTPGDIQKGYLAHLEEHLNRLNVKYLMICDAEYFRTLTKNQISAESSLGQIFDSPDWMPGFKITYCPNYRAAFRNPQKCLAEVDRALRAVLSHRDGSYTVPGKDIIHFAAYPKTAVDIQVWLQKLLAMDCDLTADVETFSLKHYTSGLGTISFAWSKHEGIAFPVDLVEDPHERLIIRGLLKEFFEEYQKRGYKMRWHSISFDVTISIYQLWMDHILDTEGLLTGLDIMMTNFDCTKVITYLATNSTDGNKLGLKHNALEFSGDYGINGINSDYDTDTDEDGDDIVRNIADIRSIPLGELLEYNLKDTLSTWYVYEKYWPKLIADDQLEIYETVMKPALVDIIQMQLTGLPIDRTEVRKLRIALYRDKKEATKKIVNSPLIQAYNTHLREKWISVRNNKLKKKQETQISAMLPKARAKWTFNPNSGPQLQELLYDERFLDLPVLDFTKTKLPATGGKTMLKLVNHTDDPETKELIEALIQLKSTAKILTDFIPKFLAAPQGPDGWHYFFGNFNLGGTISGRLSSSGPNLQNLPAGGKRWGKEVKRCFRAPPGWLLVGLDFASLEDRISALLTKDPNKLKIYTDGFDGHSYRAYSYFGEQMPDIIENDVDSINSIASLYKPQRSDSKTPTFLLTYGGTFHGIMDQMGWPMSKAKSVEDSYHELYKVSDEWVAARIEEATKVGFITCAFGLRVRTPLLKQVILGNSKTPYEAKAEARTAGNALGQSYGLLNSRAGSEFMQKVRKSPHRLDIRPSAQIHDAGYFMIREDWAVLLYTNEHLVKAVEWQDDPAIWHDEVKLGGELSIFFPTWADEMEVPNGAEQGTIELLASKHLDKLAEKGIHPF